MSPKGKQAYAMLECKEPGCGNVFRGYIAAKYCPIHKKQKNRKEKIHNKKDLENLVIEEDSSGIIEKTCTLEGCENKYTVTLDPNQKVYPGHCEEHRNKQKREHYLRMLKRKNNS